METVAEWKRVSYRNGWFMFPVPPGPTRQWSEVDWINYVDRCGVWTGPKQLPEDGVEQARRLT